MSRACRSAYWPYAAGDFRQTETPLKAMRFAYSDDFGASFESRWYLFNLLGVEKPQGVDAMLSLDYFSKRGPGVGIERRLRDREPLRPVPRLLHPRHRRGRSRPVPRGRDVPTTENRGRLTWRHREFLPEGWELTLEGSYISDPQLPRRVLQRRVRAGQGAGDARLPEEAAGQLGVHRAGPVADPGLPDADRALARPGLPLDRRADRRHRQLLQRVAPRASSATSPTIARCTAITTTLGSRRSAATRRNEVEFPIKVGDASVVPFAMARTGLLGRQPV